MQSARERAIGKSNGEAWKNKDGNYRLTKSWTTNMNNSVKFRSQECVLLLLLTIISKCLKNRVIKPKTYTLKAFFFLVYTKITFLF